MKRNTFRFCAQSSLFTYSRPYNPISKQMILDHFEANFRIEKYIICQQEHEDGGKHYHAWFKFETKIDVRRRQLFIVNQNNFNCSKGLAVYCTKFDKEPLTNMTPQELGKGSKQKTKDELGLQLVNGRDPYQLVLENPKLIFNIVDMYKNVNLFNSIKWYRQTLNVKVDKKRHQWHHGVSDSGKSTWVRNNRSPNYRFQIPNGSSMQNWATYNGQKYILIQEFTGNLSIQRIDQIADGGIQVNTKGSHTRLRNDIILIIICLKKIDEIFETIPIERRQQLHNRFTEIEHRKGDWLN